MVFLECHWTSWVNLSLIYWIIGKYKSSYKQLMSKYLQHFTNIKRCWQLGNIPTLVYYVIKLCLKGRKKELCWKSNHSFSWTWCSEHKHFSCRIVNIDLVSAFVVDYSGYQIYFPNSTQNTMLSAYLDGTDTTDIRTNVQKAEFILIKSLVPSLNFSALVFVM